MTNFLQPGQCLLALDNSDNEVNITSITYIGQLMRTYIKDDILWYDLILLTDSGGKTVTNNNIITVSADKIVSNRDFQLITPSRIYTDNVITAKSFVQKDILEKPLQGSTRSGFGSGIYGYYDKPDRSSTIIEMKNPYMLQDIDHGNSLTVASLQSNRFLDNILIIVRGDEDFSFSHIKDVISDKWEPHLFTVWNIVLHRTSDFLSSEDLINIFTNYIYLYFTSNIWFDTYTKQSLQDLPVNHVLSALSYTGILTKENIWDRGSVSYDYSKAVIFLGETAPY